MPPTPPTLLLLGATGQVGHELRRTLKPLGTIVAPERDVADLGTPASLRRVVHEVNPDWIVNAAAYTAVDQAESEPYRARTINAEAPAVLAEEAAALGAWMVHYSTDYVFDGTARRPYTEADVPRPINVYGRTKREGEEAVQAAGGKHLILRTSWVYSHRRSNFLRTMLRLAGERDRLTVVDDQTGSPTWAGWIARATAQIVDVLMQRDDPAAVRGLYHLSAAGQTSWYGFARALLARLLPHDVEVVPIPSDEYPTEAPRPAYAVLNSRRVQDTFGIRVPNWTEQLAAFAAQHAAPEGETEDAR